jgi:hypothetical protein
LTAGGGVTLKRAPTPLLLPYGLHRPEATHPRIIEDLLDVVDGRARKAMIEMLTDLYQRGRDSRYAEKLEGLPLWELKTRSRGGPKGGARVYFAFTRSDEALVINAEVKDGDTPSAAKITEAVAITLAYTKGHVRLQGVKR